MTTPTRPPFAPPPVAPDVTPPTPPTPPVTLRAWAQWAGMLVNTVTLVVVLVKLQTAFLSWEWSIPLWAVVAASAVGVAFFALPLVLSWHIVKYSITLMQQRLYSLGRNDTAVRRAYRDAHAPRPARADRIDAIPIHRANQGSVQTTYHARVVPAEPMQTKSGDTQRLIALPDYEWPPEAQAVYKVGQQYGNIAWRTCQAAGLTRAVYTRGVDWINARGGVMDPKPGGKGWFWHG